MYILLIWVWFWFYSTNTKHNSFSIITLQAFLWHVIGVNPSNCGHERTILSHKPISEGTYIYIIKSIGWYSSVTLFWSFHGPSVGQSNISRLRWASASNRKDSEIGALQNQLPASSTCEKPGVESISACAPQNIKTILYHQGKPQASGSPRCTQAASHGSYPEHEPPLVCSYTKGEILAVSELPVAADTMLGGHACLSVAWHHQRQRSHQPVNQQASATGQGPAVPLPARGPGTARSSRGTWCHFHAVFFKPVAVGPCAGCCSRRFSTEGPHQDWSPPPALSSSSGTGVVSLGPKWIRGWVPDEFRFFRRGPMHLTQKKAPEAVSPMLFLQPIIRCQPTPLGPRCWAGHQPHGRWITVAFGNKHKSPGFINAKGRSKTACKFSAVSSCFLIWLAPLSPGNLPQSLRLRWGVQAIVSSLKAPHLSNKCFLTKSKKETLDFSEQILFIVSLSISFLSRNVFREYAWVRENFGSSKIKVHNRIH